MVATYPSGRRAGCRRHRRPPPQGRPGLGITHVVVTPEERPAGRRQPGVEPVAVVANEPSAPTAWSTPSASARTAGPSPSSCCSTLDLPQPGPTRPTRCATAAFGRVRAAIDHLQADGVQARGEVLDGDAAAAARVASPPTSRRDPGRRRPRGPPRLEDALSASAAAGGVPVEQHRRRRRGPGLPVREQGSWPPSTRTGWRPRPGRAARPRAAASPHHGHARDGLLHRLRGHALRVVLHGLLPDPVQRGRQTGRR